MCLWTHRNARILPSTPGRSQSTDSLDLWRLIIEGHHVTWICWEEVLAWNWTLVWVWHSFLATDHFCWEIEKTYFLQQPSWQQPIQSSLFARSVTLSQKTYPSTDPRETLQEPKKQRFLRNLSRIPMKSIGGPRGPHWLRSGSTMMRARWETSEVLGEFGEALYYSLT